MDNRQRESQFPNRPTVLRRGNWTVPTASGMAVTTATPSIRTTPLTTRTRSMTGAASHDVSNLPVQLVSSILRGIGRLIRTVVFLVIIGVIGWNFLGAQSPAQLEHYERMARQLFDDIKREVMREFGLAPSKAIQTTQTRQQPVEQPSSQNEAWLTHLNRAIELAKQPSEMQRAEAEFMNALFQAEEFGESDPRLNNVLDHFGFFYDQNGQYQAALEYYLRALNGYRTEVGERHEHFISIARRIAYAYRAESDYELALDYLQVAIDAASGLHGQDYFGLAYGYREIGDIKVWQGDEAGARGAYRKALEISKTSLGANHQLTTDLVSSLEAIE